MSCEEHRCSNGLRALDALWVVVRHLAGDLGDVQSLIQTLCIEAHRTDPHTTAVAPAVVRFRLTLYKPTLETAAISCPRVFQSELTHTLHEVFVTVRLIFRQPFRYGERHHRVISKLAARCQQMKVIILCVVELVHGANHVTNNCT